MTAPDGAAARQRPDGSPSTKLEWPSQSPKRLSRVVGVVSAISTDVPDIPDEIWNEKRDVKCFASARPTDLKPPVCNWLLMHRQQPVKAPIQWVRARSRLDTTSGVPQSRSRRPAGRGRYARVFPDNAKFSPPMPDDVSVLTDRCRFAVAPGSQESPQRALCRHCVVPRSSSPPVF